MKSPDPNAQSKRTFFVQCHAGYRAEEKPLRFGVKGGWTIEVEEILEQHREECAEVFRSSFDDLNSLI
jgi:hypothetical protein